MDDYSTGTEEDEDERIRRAAVEISREDLLVRKTYEKIQNKQKHANTALQALMR